MTKQSLPYDLLLVRKHPWLLTPRKLQVDILYDSPELLKESDVDYFAGLETENTAYEIQWALGEMGHSANIYAVSDANFSAVMNSLTGEIIFNQVEENDLGEKVLKYAEVHHQKITGVDSHVFRLSWDKVKIKEIFFAAGIPSPWYRIFDLEENIYEGITDWPFPLIVKSADDHGSKSVIRTSVVHNLKELKGQVSWVRETIGGRVLIEQFIKGRELAATVIGNKKPVLAPLKEILFGSVPEDEKIITFENKWMSNEANAVRSKMVSCPADLPAKTFAEVSQIVLSAYKVLKVRDYARFDLRLDREECYIIDFNSNPAIAYDSSFRISLETFGLSYPAAINAILALAWDRDH